MHADDWMLLTLCVMGFAAIAIAIAVS